MTCAVALSIPQSMHFDIMTTKTRKMKNESLICNIKLESKQCEQVSYLKFSFTFLAVGSEPLCATSFA